MFFFCQFYWNISKEYISIKRNHTFILWRKNLPATRITSHSGSIIGLKLDNDASQILLLNVYLPYCCPENFDAYQTYLGELSSFCNINAALEIFILGDFNAGKGNQFWKILMDFCEDNNFIISDDSLLPDTSFTYISDSHNFTSWINHCVTSAMAHRLIINIEVLLEYICSDHHPLLVKISYSSAINHHSNIRDQKSSDYKHTNWKNLTPRKKAEYYQFTKSYLSNLLLPLEVINCNNTGCNDSAHLESISTLGLQLFQNPLALYYNLMNFYKRFKKIQFLFTFDVKRSRTKWF